MNIEPEAGLSQMETSDGPGSYPSPLLGGGWPKFFIWAGHSLGPAA
jgi:hypothetical protein